MLLSKGGSVLSKNNDRSTVLHVVSALPDPDKGLAMLERVLELIVQAGKQHTEAVNMQTTRGVKPLSVACRVGNLDVIRTLLVAGADAWSQDEEGNTALHHTENLMEGSDKVIELVCKKQPNNTGEKLVEVQNNAGNTPMLPSKMKMEDCKMQ